MQANDLDYCLGHFFLVYLHKLNRGVYEEVYYWIDSTVSMFTHLYGTSE